MGLPPFRQKKAKDLDTLGNVWTKDGPPAEGWGTQLRPTSFVGDAIRAPHEALNVDVGVKGLTRS